MGMIAGFVSIQACASNPQPSAQSPVSQPPSQPAVEQPSVPQTIESEAQPVVEQSPQELIALRQSLEKGDVGEIDTNAHLVIDRFPETPEAAEALRALADLSIRNKKYETAQMYAETAYAINAENPDNGLLLARCLHALNRDNEAVKLLDDMIGKNSDKAELFALKAAILLEYLDVERAMQAAQKAHDLKPNDCGVGVVYADALYASKSFSQAASAYESVRQQCSLTEESLQNLAKLYEVHTQNPQKACELYKQLTAINPDNAYYKASRDYQCAL